TFLSLQEHADRFRGDASFRTFLFAIAKNVLLKFFRSGSGPRGKVELGTVSVVDMGQSPSRIVADNERRQLLLTALRHLTLDQQTILELHYWEDMKVAELAAVMELPLGTVKTRMRAARKRLEALIEELAGSAHLLHATLSDLPRDPDDDQ
ncbi:MAG: sigma-70 family RNA polymerase sigma factor, partial [Deltaproteobacteria bacterium]|nr:sigma-70 family RNA polymerase sigma factor [Deltaproteobacteria bacterium]